MMVAQHILDKEGTIMSYRWPEDTGFTRIALEVEERRCRTCVEALTTCDHRHHRLLAIHGCERRPMRRETPCAWPSTVCNRRKAMQRSTWCVNWNGNASGVPKPCCPVRPPKFSSCSPRLGCGPSAWANPCVGGYPING